MPRAIACSPAFCGRVRVLINRDRLKLCINVSAETAMATTLPKRTWRRVDLQAIARDDPIRKQLDELCLRENIAPAWCFIAASFIAMVYMGSVPPRQADPEFWYLICFVLVGFGCLCYALVKQRRQRATTTAITAKPKLMRGLFVVAVIELVTVSVITVGGSDPAFGHFSLLETVLIVNLLIAAVTWISTERLRARLLANPEVSRILAENVAQARSSVYKNGRAPLVEATTAAQRATPHQDLAVARWARLKNFLWGIPLALCTLVFAAPRGLQQGWHLNEGVPVSLFVAAFVGIVALYPIASWLSDRAERRRAALSVMIKTQTAPSAQYALQKDHRPPILFLRSFSDDAAANGGQRFEELISPWFTRYGPLVAIGDPRDGLPDLGAYRDYVADENWQKLARTYIDAAAVIVMIPGQSHWI